MEDVFNNPRNIETLLFNHFRRGKFKSFESQLLEFAKQPHPAAAHFAQAHQKWAAQVEAEAAHDEELGLEHERHMAQEKKSKKQQYSSDLMSKKIASDLLDYLAQFKRLENEQLLIVSLPEFKSKIRELIKEPMQFKALFSNFDSIFRSHVFHLFEYSFLESLAKQNKDDFEHYCPEASEWLEAMKPKSAQLPSDLPIEGIRRELKPVKNYYRFTGDHRFHLFSVEYEGKKGDQAKAAILNQLSQDISKHQSKESLAAFKATTMSDQSEEFKLLNTGTGFFTRVFGLKTDSVVALENMFKDAESWYTPKA